MRKIGITLTSALLLFFCSSFVLAQNQSAENSNVIETHIWFTDNPVFNCSGYEILMDVRIHEIIKTMPDGTGQFHWIIIAKGYDQNDNLWIYRQNWNESWGGGDYQNVRTIHLIGPNGEKLSARMLFILNGNGEIIQNIWEPLNCS